ncbi:MAG: imidazole glycerol phosphate synthase cyclase subunit [Planctomycetes bacterium]|nr:imidazole glycerol phosphate synthase cyclase subunit [Planctomycetota bacterium]
MKPVRIMPCLDIKEGRVVKGVQFEQLKDAGDPVETAVAYENGGADELAFLDISATVEKRLPLFDILVKVADAVKIPVTVGGGLKTTAEVGKAFDSGAACVSISSAAFRDPDFVKESVKLFGGKRVIVAIDTLDNNDLPSGREVVIEGGRTRTGRDAVEFAKKIGALGVGGLLVTSKSTDGCKNGYDIHGLRQIRDATGLPIVASGGAGRVEHFLQAAREGGAEVLLAASVFHFGELTIRQVKEYLRDNGVSVLLPKEPEAPASTVA